jgi:hypothetical protein
MNEDFSFGNIDEDEVEGFDHSGVDSGENDDSCDYEDDELSLGLVKFVGTESGGINVYEFIFTKYPDEFWGEGYDTMPSGICNYIEPEFKFIQKTVKVRMTKTLDLAQKNCCFSMQDCMDGIVALAWESLIGLEEYPEIRLIFHFGESYETVENKLAQCHILIG